ncbi:hypothetical protein [Pseudomonas sp. RIT-PI-AD]|nr:hypothetical protein [Pseudomonas sp. RIT-PI-AD]
MPVDLLDWPGSYQVESQCGITSHDVASMVQIASEDSSANAELEVVL